MGSESIDSIDSDPIAPPLCRSGAAPRALAAMRLRAVTEGRDVRVERLLLLRRQHTTHFGELLLHQRPHLRLERCPLRAVRPDALPRRGAGRPELLGERATLARVLLPDRLHLLLLRVGERHAAQERAAEPATLTLPSRAPRAVAV